MKPIRQLQKIGNAHFVHFFKVKIGMRRIGENSTVRLYQHKMTAFTECRACNHIGKRIKRKLNADRSDKSTCRRMNAFCDGNRTASHRRLKRIQHGKGSLLLYGSFVPYPFARIESCRLLPVEIRSKSAHFVPIYTSI